MFLDLDSRSLPSKKVDTLFGESKLPSRKESLGMAHERIKTTQADAKIKGVIYLTHCSTVREREFQNKESNNYTLTVSFISERF